MRISDWSSDVCSSDLAVDAAGKPTTDPVAALGGFLLPFGAHKGSGLSQAIELLSGVLAGGRFLTDITPWTDFPEQPSGTGHFFLLIDPKRLLGDAYDAAIARFRSEEHTSELQSLMRISYAAFCLKKKKNQT